MKRILIAAAAVIAISAAAQADPFAGAYGNTVTETMPDGVRLTIYVNTDMTWQQTVGGKVTKGTYAWKDATHVCFTATDPVPADPSKATNCNEIKGDHKVGDTWTDAMPGGKSITIAISAGRS